MGFGVFSCCFELASVVISGSLTSIGAATFHMCRELTSIVIPDSVTSIGCDAFSYCTGLKSIVIPESVTSIDNNGGVYKVFEGCDELEQVIAPARFHRLFRGVASVTESTQFLMK
jgi:hypothetical protein